MNPCPTCGGKVAMPLQVKGGRTCKAVVHALAQEVVEAAVAWEEMQRHPSMAQQLLSAVVRLREEVSK